MVQQRSRNTRLARCGGKPENLNCPTARIVFTSPRVLRARFNHEMKPLAYRRINDLDAPANFARIATGSAAWRHRTSPKPPARL